VSGHGHASPRRSLLTCGCQSELTQRCQPRDSLENEQMEGALSPSDASADLISSRFSTWQRREEMYLDLRPPGSPRGLVTTLACWRVLGTERFATWRRDEPGPSSAVAKCFASQALLGGGEQGEARRG